MRTRAYRPEVLDCLEERSLLSGVAGLSAHHPVVLTHRRLLRAREQVRLHFLQFARDRVPDVLLDDLYNTVVIIPFGRVDGLGVTIKRIVDGMQEELSAHVPGAIRAARNDVVAATLATVQARVQAGDVVVR